MYRDPTTWLPERQWHPRKNERVVFDLFVRYAWRGLRGTLFVRDLTPDGARIEGIEGLTTGDGLVLLLPDLPATDATVAWAQARAAGLVFDEPIPAEDYAALVRDHASARPTMNRAA